MSIATYDLTVEAEAKTVSEAKGRALAEMQRRYPTLDESAVDYQVICDGDGTMGGVTIPKRKFPARVVARVSLVRTASQISERVVVAPATEKMSPGGLKGKNGGASALSASPGTKRKKTKKKPTYVDAMQRCVAGSYGARQ